MALWAYKGVASVFSHLSERDKMKERDKEIEEERNLERAREQQTLQMDGYCNMTIQHFSHHHPLRHVYKPTAFRCSTCSVVSSGWAYACEAPGCGYLLHAVCSGRLVVLRPATAAGDGRAPIGGSQEITTFAHRRDDHPVREIYSNLEYKCNHCFTNGKGRHYKCGACDVSIHPVCAKNPTRISTFMHPQHELELRTKKRFRRCNICDHSLNSGQKGLNLRVYGCKECQFWVHPMCSQLPQYLLHDLHPMRDPPHMLQLKLVESTTTIQCDARCGSSCTNGWHYVCSLCSVNFHIECILRHSVKEASRRSNMFGMIGNFLHLADAA